MSGHWIDLERWPRRGHFAFFSDYEQPFFSLCTDVGVAPTQAWCRAQRAPLSLALWYAVIRALDAVPALRLRLRPEGVWAHDRVYVASTVALPDETFGFCHFPWAATFPAFVTGAQAALAALRARTDPVDDRPEEDGLVHGSVVPWIRFTGLMHARRLGDAGSVPKIVLGKVGEIGGEIRLPISVEAHHALVDGVHVARFLEALEAALATPEATFAA